MATAVLVRGSKQTTKTSVEAEQKASTEALSSQLSLNLVRNLLRITISNITYLRAMFDEDCFENCIVEGQPLKMLRKNVDKRADTLMSWADACFEALQKQYLRQAVLAIYNDPEDPQTLVESYTFKFEHRSRAMSVFKGNEQVPVATASNPEEIKKATLKMLRTLVVLTQMLKPMPEGQSVTMRLFYYDEVTPMGYQPQGFRGADDTPAFGYEDKPLNIKAGDVCTPWHELKLRVKACKTQFHVQEAVSAEEDALGQQIDDEDDQQQLGGRSVDLSTVAQPRSSTILQTVPNVTINNAQRQQQEEHQQQEEQQVPCTPAELQQDAQASADAALATNASPNSQPVQAVSSYQQHPIAVESVREGAGGAVPTVSSPEPVMDNIVPLPTPMDTSSDVDVQGECTKLSKRVTARHHRNALPLAVDTVPIQEVIKCICTINNEEQCNTMVQCSTCDAWSHTVCYGFFNPSIVPDVFQCFFCSSKTEEPSFMLPTALWRLTLSEASTVTAINSKFLRQKLTDKIPNVTVENAEQLADSLMDQLMEERLVSQRIDRDGKYKTSKKAIKLFISGMCLPCATTSTRYSTPKPSHDQSRARRTIPSRDRAPTDDVAVDDVANQLKAQSLSISKKSQVFSPAMKSATRSYKGASKRKRKQDDSESATTEWAPTLPPALAKAAVENDDSQDAFETAEQPLAESSALHRSKRLKSSVAKKNIRV